MLAETSEWQVTFQRGEAPFPGLSVVLALLNQRECGALWHTRFAHRILPQELEQAAKKKKLKSTTEIESGGEEEQEVGSGAHEDEDSV